jgi:glycolate oxidase
VDAGRLLEALGRALPGDRIVADPDVLAAMSHDEAEWAPAGRAAAGVRARSESEVQQVVRVCAEFGAAVVPRGAGTGLSGGANAVDGCVVLDLARMDRVVEIDRDNLLCVVQPGVVNNDLKAAVAEHGLWYPPDPASAPWSTIGGNVATNAGGLCCLKYGVTRERWSAGPGPRPRSPTATRCDSAAAPPKAWPGSTWSGCSSDPRARSAWSPR